MEDKQGVETAKNGNTYAAKLILLGDDDADETGEGERGVGGSEAPDIIIPLR